MVPIDWVGLPLNICSGIARCEHALVTALKEKTKGKYYANNEYSCLSKVRKYFNFLRMIVGGYPNASSRNDISKIVHVLDQNSAWILPFLRLRHPVIVTVYDLFMYDNQDNLPTNVFERLKYWCIFRTIKVADGLTTISETTRREIALKLKYPAEKIAVIYEAVDHTIFRPMKVSKLFLKKYDLPSTKKIILNVGTEIPRKNVQTLIRAFAKLYENNKEVILVKIGRPLYARYREENKRLVRKLGLEGRVFFIDYVSDNDLVLFYSAASVVVAPSLYEGGFALSLLEAMACGCPVIYANIDALRETVGSAGIAVPAKDSTGLAQAINSVLSDKKYANRLRKEGLQRAKIFTWNHSAENLLAFYEKIIKMKETG